MAYGCCSVSFFSVTGTFTHPLLPLAPLRSAMADELRRRWLWPCVRLLVSLGDEIHMSPAIYGIALYMFAHMNKLSYMSVTTVLWDGAMRDLTLVCVLCEPEIRCVEQTRAEGGLYLCMRQCFSSWSLIWFAMWDRSRGLSDCKPSQWKHLCACLLHQNTFAPLSRRIFHTLYLVCLLQKYLLLFTLFHLPQLLLVTVDINLFGLLYWWKGDGYFQCNVGFLS